MAGTGMTATRRRRTMIESVIRWSVGNRFLVLLATLILAGGGLFSLKNTPVDAIPDLSDVQVIIKTGYPGQAPQVVEDQVTYPLTTAMLSVPGAVTVRGYSFFGDSYVYVIFAEDTDLYWARSRVLEYLSQVALPAAATPQLGPDASGVGWVYLYALIDRTGRHDISQLRSIQDWYLQYELQTVPGVSEVATVGGMVKQYQVTVDPEKLRAFGMPLAHIQMAIKRANQEVGASVVEMAEAEYMVRTSGYIQSEQDLANIPLGVNENGTPLRLRDVAEINLGPRMRRGIAELNGEGETVGGIVVMRFGENAQRTIDGVKARLEQLQQRRDHAGRGRKDTPRDDDRGRHYRRSPAHSFRRRRRFRGDESHCRAHGRRHAQRRAVDPAGPARGVLPVAATAVCRARPVAFVMPAMRGGGGHGNKPQGHKHGGGRGMKHDHE